MNIQRVISSPAELVSVAELKEHLRIEHDAEDTILKNLQRAAYDWVEQFTGRSILTSHWKFLTEPLKGGTEVHFSLPFPDLLEVEEVHHVFREGKNPSTREQIKYYTMNIRHGISYISLISKGAPIEILYSAGFGPHPDAVPQGFHHAIKILVAHWYQNREGIGCGIPETVEIFLRPYQIRRLI